MNSPRRCFVCDSQAITLCQMAQLAHIARDDCWIVGNPAFLDPPVHGGAHLPKSAVLAVHHDEQVEDLAHLQNTNTHNMAKLTPEFRLLETHVHVSRVLKPIIRSKRVERDEPKAQ